MTQLTEGWSNTELHEFLQKKEHYKKLFDDFNVKRKILKQNNQKYGLRNNREEDVYNEILLKVIELKEIKELGEFEIYSQVSLRQIYDDALHDKEKDTVPDLTYEEDKEDFYRSLQNRSIDFLIVDKSKDFFAAIEVNGSVHFDANDHNIWKEAVLEAFMETAKIPFYHIDSKFDNFKNEKFVNYQIEHIADFLKRKIKNS